MRRIALLVLLVVLLPNLVCAESALEYVLQDGIKFGMTEEEVKSIYDSKYETMWQQVDDEQLNGIMFFTEWLGEKDIIPAFYTYNGLKAVRYTVFGKTEKEKGEDFDNVSQYLHDTYGKPTSWVQYNLDGTDPRWEIINGTYSRKNLVSVQEWLYSNVRIRHYIGTFDRHLSHAVTFAQMPNPFVLGTDEFYFYYLRDKLKK